MIENTNATMSDLGYWGGNVTVLLTDAGVILVDSKFERAHDDIVAKVKSLTDQPIKYVILTHNHGDHADGAQKMEAMGATVIISADDRDNLARDPKASWLPAVGYIGQMQLLLGGKDVELHQLRGHTRGDTVVYFPADRVVSVGDLLTTSDQIPGIVMYADGGNWTDWKKSMDEILKWDFDQAIPGHGPMVTKQEVMNRRNKMVAIMERVRAMKTRHAGVRAPRLASSRAQAQARLRNDRPAGLPLEAYPEHAWPLSKNLPINSAGICRSTGLPPSSPQPEPAWKTSRPRSKRSPVPRSTP
jgi:glyoxylase-like metal-dependent hydrolase (beta-lactamase superfamily II)